ncbi:MAG: hypothetical protein LUD01_11225 [Clostridiales bacterium]|nr:hypothetical protein [Clostridiales bacterium]
MSVGTASIKRAAGKATSAGTVKTEEKKEKNGMERNPVAEAKPEERNMPVTEQMRLTTNQVCHLTEELPIYLL